MVLRLQNKELAPYGAFFYFKVKPKGEDFT